LIFATAAKSTVSGRAGSVPWSPAFVFLPISHTHNTTGKTHQIDGIILTKFDTVDEKVGAALSMCYKTGQPIMFVGTGQTYTPLKQLQPAMILNCLFR